MEQLLKNKVAWVTGAASGIGLAIAERFLEEGASVVMVGQRAAKGKKQAKRLSVLGQVYFDEVDVSREHEVKRSLAKAAKKFGKVDIVVNNAGIFASSAIAKFDPEEFDKVFSVNVKGVIFGMKYALPYLKRPKARSKIGGKGAILNTASIAGLMMEAGWTTYSLSKAAVIAVTKIAALEYGKQGIRVNAIAPGFIITPMTFSEPLSKNPKPDRWIKSLPISRYGRPPDIASLAAFLCSDEADYITGAIYNVDGGALSGWLE